MHSTLLYVNIFQIIKYSIVIICTFDEKLGLSAHGIDFYLWNFYYNYPPWEWSQRKLDCQETPHPYTKVCTYTNSRTIGTTVSVIPRIFPYTSNCRFDNEAIFADEYKECSFGLNLSQWVTVAFDVYVTHYHYYSIIIFVRAVPLVYIYLCICSRNTLPSSIDDSLTRNLIWAIIIIKKIIIIVLLVRVVNKVPQWRKHKAKSGELERKIERERERHWSLQKCRDPHQTANSDQLCILMKYTFSCYSKTVIYILIFFYSSRLRL